MTRVKVADAGWAEHTTDLLEQALKSARDMQSDLAKMRICDGADCGRMFDGTDPRAATSTLEGYEYHFCPGCEADAARTAAPEDDVGPGKGS